MWGIIAQLCIHNKSIAMSRSLEIPVFKEYKNHNTRQLATEWTLLQYAFYTAFLASGLL